MRSSKSAGERARGSTGRSLTLFIAAGVAAGGLFFARTHSVAAETAVALPAAKLDVKPQQAGQQSVVLAGGCFWGVQGVFQHLRGVTSAVSGYSGGAKDTAHYERVSDGDTGHAESVKVTFDPSQISFGQILQVYFSVVQDPTELNRQGPDEGTQYRSAVFPANAEEASVAQAYIDQLGATHAFPAPIVTKVETFKGFYPAEGYHQNYLTNHPDNPYIAINDIPKVENLKRLFPALYQPSPTKVSSLD